MYVATRYKVKFEPLLVCVDDIKVRALVKSFFENNELGMLPQKIPF